MKTSCYVVSRLLPVSLINKLEKQGKEIELEHYKTEVLYKLGLYNLDDIIKEQLYENGMREINFMDSIKSFEFFDQKNLPDVDKLGECIEDVDVIFETDQDYLKAKGYIINHKEWSGFVNDIDNKNLELTKEDLEIEIAE